MTELIFVPIIRLPPVNVRICPFKLYFKKKMFRHIFLSNVISQMLEISEQAFASYGGIQF